jgi:hypothetical protein
VLGGGQTDPSLLFMTVGPAIVSVLASGQADPPLFWVTVIVLEKPDPGTV